MPRHGRGWAMGAGPNCESRHSTLTISLLEPTLLILLKEQPRHGYTLLGDLKALGMNTINPSVVYRTLREMEGLGWIQSDWETDQTQGPPRRIYHLAAQSEEVLRKWQSELGRVQEIIVQLIKRVK